MLATPFSHEQLESHAVALAAAHPRRADPRARPARCCRGSTRAPSGSRTPTGSCRRSPAPTRSRSPPRTGCATTTTSSRIRSARSGRTCRGSSTSSCRSSRDGPLRGYPRVYLIARELIAHTAGRLDLETLVDFTAAYQRVAPLSIGETWAIPIMLRLALVEELRRLVDGVVAARRSREQARQWEARSRRGRDHRGERHRRACSSAEVEANGRLPPAFVVELLQWLRDQPPSAAPAWQALQRALEAQGDSAEELLRVEHQREAADQLAIGNISPACGCCRRSTGRCSSTASAWSSRSSARIRPARTRRWTFRRAIATATRSRSCRSGSKQPETVVAERGDRAGARGAGPRSGQRSAASRRLLPDFARAIHSREDLRLSAERCASGWPASSSSIPPSATSAPSRIGDALGVASLLAYAAPARRDAAASCGSSR